MKTLQILSVIALAAGAALAQPAVSSISNGASYIPAALPNGGIAQGSLFVVKGSNLGPTNVVIATSFPLQTTLGGTSVSVTVGGKTVSAIMYYTLAAQVSAILPSTTPTGTGTFTVTYNGQTSAPAPITVVGSAFGMFTVNQGGSGDAIAFLNADNGLLTPTHAAQPGEVVVFWGTGLGPITGDETRPAPGGDMTNIPLEVYIGGKQVPAGDILYRGRNACCSSVDTVYVKVPAGTAGCVAPVVMKIGSIVSNGASIPVANSGRACPPTTSGVSTTDLSGLLAKGNISIGTVSLTKSVSTTAGITVGGITVGGGTTRSDTGSATFLNLTVPQGGSGVVGSLDVANFGACTVLYFTTAGAGNLPSVSFNSLDAGASIGINGPTGAKTLNKISAGGLTTYTGNLDSNGNYLTAGQFTATGPGGPQVGAFTASLNLPPTLTWTNQAAITSVNRAAGVTVNWTGGDPSGYVQITGFSFSGQTAATGVGATFTCTAKTSDGSFTVPSYVLLSLPPSGTISQGGVSIAIPGSLGVSGFTQSTRFTASGLDYATMQAGVSNGSQVTYQ